LTRHADSWNGRRLFFQILGLNSEKLNKFGGSTRFLLFDTNERLLNQSQTGICRDEVVGTTFAWKKVRLSPPFFDER
jgi:hypothetical protein